MRGGSYTNNYPLIAEERALSAETVPATAGHVAAAADELRRLADEYVDDLARRHPDTATELGDHRFDELLPDRSEAALADERRALDDVRRQADRPRRGGASSRSCGWTPR